MGSAIPRSPGSSRPGVAASSTSATPPSTATGDGWRAGTARSTSCSRRSTARPSTSRTCSRPARSAPRWIRSRRRSRPSCSAPARSCRCTTAATRSSRGTGPSTTPRRASSRRPPTGPTRRASSRSGSASRCDDPASRPDAPGRVPAGQGIEKRGEAVRGLSAAAVVAGLVVLGSAPGASAYVQPCGGTSWVGGSTNVCRGTVVYRDYVYDDEGADTGDIGYSGTQNAFGTLAHPAGDERYPADDTNSADLVRLELSRVGRRVDVVAELNALRKADSTV